MKRADDTKTEIIEVLLGGQHYGINAGIVKEIIAYHKVTLVPNAHPSIEGVFMPRNQMITAIDLKNCLQMGNCSEGGFFVITQLEELEVAFHIDSVAGIHKVENDEIIDIGFSGQRNGYVAGALKKENRIIILLDVAKIIQNINPNTIMEAVG